MAQIMKSSRLMREMKHCLFWGEKRPDLIITDITLNMMTGDTLFLYIKSMPDYKDIPVIMASDFSPQPYENLKMVDPDLVFLDKTFTKEELVNEVKAKIG